MDDLHDSPALATDRPTFDLMGVLVTARVVNLRRVNWQSFESNFFVIFSPGARARAPPRR